MKINHLTIKIYRSEDNELAYFSFYRDNYKKPFATLDGGWCTHEQFCMARDFANQGKYDLLKVGVLVELDKAPKNYSVINVYPDREETVMTTAPVFTLEELL